MSWLEVSNTIDYALSLPREQRCNSIDHGQLRLLYRIAVLKRVGRAELDRRDQDSMPVINKRLKYLLGHQLIEYDERYWGNVPRGRYSLSEQGHNFSRRLSRGRTNLEMQRGLDIVQGIVGNRQLNAAHLKILVYMATGNVVKMPDLIEHTGAHRQTVRSRLKSMASWGLISRDENTTAGGNGNCINWRLSSEGRVVITALFPEGFVGLPSWMHRRNRRCRYRTGNQP